MNHLFKSYLNQERKHVGTYWRWSQVFLKTFRGLSHMPFQEVNDDGDLEVTRQAWIFTIVTAAVQMTIIYFSHIHRVRSPQFWENYGKVLENVFRFVISITLPHMISSWCSTQLFIDYVKEWRYFEEIYYMYTGRHTFSFKPWFIKLILCFFCILILSLIILDQYIFEQNFNLLHIMPYFLTTFYTATLWSYWICNCVIIVRTVKILRNHLVKTLNGCPEADEVRRFRLLWMRLQHLATQLPVVFGAPLITQLAGYFVVYVFDVYTLVKSFTGRDHIRELGYMTPCLWCILVFMSLNESSYYLASQVGSITLLHVLSTRTQSLSSNTMKEIDLLIESIPNSSHMEVSGCIVLGRPFFIQVTRTSLTFLIVITQFDTDRTESVANTNV